MERLACQNYLRPVQDVIDLIGGKWSLPIIVALSMDTKRFNELLKLLEGITPRTLSKELKELETNGIVLRRAYNTMPMAVEYSLTPYGQSVEPLIGAMRQWGIKHREKIMAG